MDTKRRKTQFAYNKFGEFQNLFAFTTFFIFVVALLLGNMTKNHARDAFDELKSTEEMLSPEYIAFVNEQEQAPTLEIELNGNYRYEVVYQNGQTLQGELIFVDGDYVMKRMGIDESMVMSATANYEIVGSVLKYKNISGDKYLFNTSGNPLVVSDDKNITIQFDRGFQITLYPLDQIRQLEPTVVPDDRGFFQLFMDAYITAKLQLLMLLIGSMMLIYMIVMIVVNSFSKPNDKYTILQA